MTTRAPATITAVSIPSPLSGLRDGAARGTVLAVFQRSAYLDVAGRIVALAPAGLGRGPLTITLDRPRALRPLAAGEAVALDGGLLRVGGHTVDLRPSAVWDPALPAVASPAVAPAVVLREVRRGASEASVAALLDPPRGAGPTLPHSTLLRALRRGLEVIGDFLDGRTGADEVSRAVADDIAGRGPGLTPSGDDLLAGIMHAATVWPSLASRARGADLRTILRDAAAPRTTRISAAYLDAAAGGSASEPWHALVAGLRQSQAAACAAVRRLLAVGETSGADALTGFCWAWSRLDPVP
ncbi:MAG: DUF2877 domain-containing protein [Armatimonadota bacterium]|nr:DUF2877 domain-containing protein [Armatimonadota bacterium]MDR7519607.1 DUF2877 domain-containing protein [Armatimonadota bacterium]